MERTKISNISNKLFGISELLAEFIYSHPIFSAAWLCICCICIPAKGTSLTGTVSLMLGTAVLGGTIAIYYYGRNKDKDKNSLKFSVITGVCSLAAALLFGYWIYIKGVYGPVILNGGLAAVGSIFLCLAAKNKLTAERIILLLFAAGFIMRLSYVIYMPVNMIQHDAYGLGSDAGHTAYIEYFINNGHLPDFDVRTIDQFYHPPFHHIIAALWMKIQMMCGISIESAHENVQLLTLFYSTLCMILSYKIFRRAGLRKSGLIAATAVIAFCPAFYILSGSINNDILSIALMLGALYNTLCWYKSRSIGRIICIALCIGLGMFTKLSVWMAAPPIAFIFIYVFFKDIKNIRKYLIQYIAFLAVCAPIGLFWSIRNLVRFGVPVTFVQRLSENSSQYVGNIPITTRLFDISSFQFKDMAEQFTMYKGTYNEYNPLVGFFKTSNFDEGIAYRRFPTIAGFDQILFWSSVILGLAGFAALIYMLVSRSDKLKMPVKVFIASTYFLILIMYYVFCITFPHVCTQNVRYGVPLIVIGALSLGYLIRGLLNSGSKAKKITAAVLSSVIGIYALSGYMVYNAVAMSFVKF